MPKDFKTYTLFIASPGDITSEKHIIIEMVDQWNKFRGSFINVRVETTDWDDAYPQHGDRPQAIINEQIFDNCDFVVALFWTRFGMATGVANSGTEEEILRAINLQKPLLLYFSDVNVPPSKLNGVEYEKIKSFRAQHNNSTFYRVYDSIENFKSLFQRNLSSFLDDFINANNQQSKDSPAESQKKIHPQKEVDETGSSKYQPPKDIEKKIKLNFPSYWTKLYGIVDDKSAISDRIKISKNNKEDINKLKIKLKDWERQIEEYSNKLKKELENINAIPPDELKYEILKEELWTVGSALGSFDSELWLFKKTYEGMASFKIKEVVLNIVNSVEQYKTKLPDPVKNDLINKPESFGFKLLNPSETLLSGVIGKGIRSEILHKLNPQFFPLMTRRSIWALFFLSDEASEFIVDQNKEGRFRTVHNWDYLYDHFAYFNHCIFIMLSQEMAKHKIFLKKELKYGYINLFLVDIFKSHKKQIESLRKLH